MTTLITPAFILAVVKKDSDGTFIEGYASFGSNQYDPRSTMFSLASNTKQFTALSVALLMEDKQTKHHFPLGWKTPIKDVIPDFQLKDPEATEHLTFEDALCHRSGLARHDFTYGGFGPKGCEELVHQLRYLDPSAGLRQDFQYTDRFYYIMALLPSLLKQESYSAFLKKHIFETVVMTRTTFELQEAEDWGMAYGYFKANEHSKKLVQSAAHIAEEFPEDFGTLRGAAGLHSCAQDMIQWLRIFLDRRDHPESDPVAKLQRNLDTMQAARIPMQKSPEWPEVSISLYGLGLLSYSYRGYEIVEHGGYDPGYHSQMTHLPNDGIGLVLFSNDNSNGTDLHTIIKWLVLDSLLGLESIDWSTRIRRRKEDEQRQQAKALESILANAEAPIIPVRSMEGTYSHPAYGPFVLKEFTSSSIPDAIITAEDASAILEWMADEKRKPAGLIKSDKVWAKYMVMRHLNRDTYSLTFLLLTREKGTGKRLVVQDNRTGDVTLAKGTLVFGGNFWGAADPTLKGEVIFQKES